MDKENTKMKQKAKNAALFVQAHPAFAAGVGVVILNPFMFGGSGWQSVVRAVLFVSVPAALGLYAACVFGAKGDSDAVDR